MDVYLCEKPSQGRDLARVLGVSQRGDGYLHDGAGRHVTWAVGHLLSEYEPQDYDERFKRWVLNDLPIVPTQWQQKVSHHARDQFKAVSGLLKSASRVIIATDLDREGESIARSIIDRVGFRGEILRLKLRALDEHSIRQALKDICPGEETEPLYQAAMGRSHADWLVGMNLTRAYTVLAGQMNVTEVFSIGRVQSPTIKLVVDRDAKIANFSPSPFYEIKASFEVQNGMLTAKWMPPENVLDPEDRCVNRPLCDQLAAALPGRKAVIESAEVKPSKESAPLPFSLSRLQQACSKQLGLSAKEVLTVAQALYEKHKVTSYPRSDCSYLPESQHAETPDVFQAIMLNDPESAGMVNGARADMKSRAFNDGKISAHHAIIPTRGSADVSRMTEDERNVYRIICRQFIAQFYSPHHFDRTHIIVECGGQRFEAKGKTTRKAGWRVLFSGTSAEEKDDDKPADEVEQQQLPAVKHGEPSVCRGAEVDSKMTRPPPHFTDATLIGAMENVARYTDDPKIKKVLAETAGLGTEATRSDTIEGAIQRGYLSRDKTIIKSTNKARAMISMAPPAVTSPVMTGLWEQQLSAIANGQARRQDFERQIIQWMSDIIKGIQGNTSTILQQSSGPLAPLMAPTHPCPVCQSTMVLRHSKPRAATKTSPARKGGPFWACSKQECRATRPDNNGVPGERGSSESGSSRGSSPGVIGPKNAMKSTGYKCPECQGPMKKRSSASGNDFWGCMSYPACKGTRKGRSKKTTS